MRYLALTIFCIAMIGCGPSAERKQYAADAIAATNTVAKMEGSATAAVVAKGIEARILAATDCPRSDLPAPSAEATQCWEKPAEWAASAPPEPSGEVIPSWLWAAAGTGLVGLLAVARKAIPGPVGMLVNLGWDLFATYQQKKADQLQKLGHDCAKEAADMLHGLLVTIEDAEFRRLLTPVYDKLVENQRAK